MSFTVREARAIANDSSLSLEERHEQLFALYSDTGAEVIRRLCHELVRVMENDRQRSGQSAGVTRPTGLNQERD